jgi:hypothetical protein
MPQLSPVVALSMMSLLGNETRIPHGRRGAARFGGAIVSYRRRSVDTEQTGRGDESYLDCGGTGYGVVGVVGDGGLLVSATRIRLHKALT